MWKITVEDKTVPISPAHEGRRSKRIVMRKGASVVVNLGSKPQRVPCLIVDRSEGGFRLRGGTLHLDPCIPRAWRGFEITFRHHSARYEIMVENPRSVTRGVSRVELDGAPLAGGAAIALADDGATHRVHVVLG